MLFSPRTSKEVMNFIKSIAHPAIQNLYLPIILSEITAFPERKQLMLAGTMYQEMPGIHSNLKFRVYAIFRSPIHICMMAGYTRCHR